MMKTAYLDCFSGIAGDMFLAASLECGLKLSDLKRELAKLNLPPRAFTMTQRQVKRSGLGATYLDVRARNTRKGTTRWVDIRKLIGKSDLSPTVKKRSLDIFGQVAKAEAQVHRCSLETLHFHEVGATDSIVDIVGAAFSVERLGLKKILAGNIHVGSGTIQTRHGTYPVPSPTVLKLLKGWPIQLGGPQGELVTPTGAAILATYARPTDAEPLLEIEKVGVGAGKTDHKGRANVFRMILGQEGPAPEEDRVSVIEANIDDMLPLNFERLFEALFKRGALDVTLTPVQMKKQRPAVQISVLVEPLKRKALAQYLLEETTSFGVRFSDWNRLKLRRSMTRVKLPQGAVGVKLGFLNGQVLKASPEYEDCKRLSDRKGISFMKVYEDAKEAARAKYIRRSNEQKIKKQVR